MRWLRAVSAALRRGEEGTVLPLIAFVLVTLLVFAAFAVDLGAAWAERRSDQSAADAAVMAGALNYLSGSTTSEDVVDTVRDYVERNLGIPAGSAEWISCTDPDRPADYAPMTDSGGNTMDCISLKQLDTETRASILRVKVPDRVLDTFFAKVIGIDTLTVSAAAEAEVGPTDPGAVIPFYVPGNPSSEECLGTPPKPLVAEESLCKGPTKGNFGVLDSPFFGSGAPHNTPDCLPPGPYPNADYRLAHQIALGIDHTLVKSPDTSLPTGINETGADSCPQAQNDGYVPFILLTQPGNPFPSGGGSSFPPSAPSQPVAAGLIGDDPTYAGAELGRLRQSGGLNSSAADRRRLAGISIDNVGLWEYISSGSGACNPALFVAGAGTANTQQMRACLDAGDPVGFSSLILDSPRFAVVPELVGPVGADWRHIVRFRPVYLQATWYKCGPAGGAGTESFCHWETDDGLVVQVMNPGEGSLPACETAVCPDPPAPKTIEMRGLSAWVLDWNDLPPGAEDEFGAGTALKVEMFR